MKKLGTYTYKHPTYNGGVRTYVEHSMRIEVVDERANKYRIKYNGFHANGVAIGSLHWVRKDKVRLDEGNGLKPMALYVNEARDIRLPYKDD